MFGQDNILSGRAWEYLLLPFKPDQAALMKRSYHYLSVNNNPGKKPLYGITSQRAKLVNHISSLRYGTVGPKQHKTERCQFS